ncbi:MAG TPA: hypothetical protein DDZ81_09290 [Acetobacteraceae bacterium]|jgi:PAS domain S-box-containing protein|nr:hypothetical protein [Acetobacteraceae bacterium]
MFETMAEPMVPRNSDTTTSADPVDFRSSPIDNRAAAGLPRLRLRGLLVGLVLAVLLPSVILGVVATSRAVSDEIGAANGRLTDTAQALALAMDQEIATQIASLSVFAESPAFDMRPASPDVPALYAQALRVVERLGAAVNVVNRDGTQLLNTRRPLGAPLPPTPTRETVEQVFATGRPAVSNLVVGMEDGRLAATTVVPVFGSDHRVILATEIAFEVEKVRDLLKAAAVPNGGFASVSDASGVIVARSDSLHQTMVGKPISLEGARAREGRAAGIFRAATNGVERVSAFHKLSAAPGWTLVVSQPTVTFDAAWQQPLLVLGGGTVLAFVVSIVLASLAARQILGPIRRLGSYARVVAAADGAILTGGTAGTLPAARIAELEILRRGFAAAEAGLRRGAQEMHALFQASPIGIARFDGRGRIHEANQAMLRILGVSRPDIEAGLIRWDERTPPEFRGVTERAFAQAMAAADGCCLAFEKEFIRPNGTRVPVLNSFAILDRETAMAAAFAVDLTELRSKDARFQLFVDRAPAGIAMFDAEMAYIAVSERFLSDYGLTTDSTESLIGRCHYDVFPDIPERWREIHRRVLAGETLSASEDAFPRADGRVDSVRWEMTPWYQADRTIGGALLFSEVITESKASREALAEGEARLRLLLDTVMEGIILASEDGKIVSANPAATRMFGYASEAELVGRPLGILMPAADAARHGSYLAKHRVADQAKAVSLPDRELIGRRKDGSEFALALSVSSFRSGDTRFFTGMLRDMTERKQAEATERHAEELERLVRARTRDLEETQAQLVQAAKMEALGRLASGMAHDFNNVLQALESSVTLARRRLGSNPIAAASALRIAASSVARGAAVTNRLLAFARRGELSATVVEPAWLLEDVAQLLRHTFGPAVALSVESGAGVPPLFADRGQLEMVLVNLANNARDALRQGVGKIHLAAASVAASGGVPTQLAPGNYVRLSVVDDGMGMAPDILRHVTEVFFTTKPEGKGTGLGLSMARGFAEQSGGALTIESTPGKGTAVSLWLPVAPAEPEGLRLAEENDTGEGAPSRRGKAILLVDDEPAVRSVLAELLGEYDHTVSEAADAASALARLAAGLAVDVVVTDFAMPGGMDGIAFIKEARRLRPGLPVLLVTGHPGEVSSADLAEAAKAGRFAVLRKPFSVKTLEARVVALLHG